MLRLIALAVIVANLAFWGYTRGVFDGWFGLRSNGDREPERLSRQVRPEAIAIIPAASMPARARLANACFEAGPVPAGEAAAAAVALNAALPPGAWTEARNEPPGGPVSYVYRVADADAATAARLATLALGAGGRYPFGECLNRAR